jgi:hypothetical protein
MPYPTRFTTAIRSSLQVQDIPPPPTMSGAPMNREEGIIIHAILDHATRANPERRLQAAV